jgi:hypothetical protein
LKEDKDWVELASKARKNADEKWDLWLDGDADRKIKYYLHKGVEEGNTDAMVRLAALLRSQLGHVNADDEMENEAERLENLAATEGNLEAMVKLGDRLLREDRPFLAQDWYYSAAQAGYRPAFLRLSELENNWSDFDKALVWSTLATTPGDSNELPAKTLPSEWADGYPGVSHEAKELEEDEVDEGSEDADEVSEGEPESRLVRNFRDAEFLAMEWMVYFGFEDAFVTNPGQDGGIDVDSSEALAQVKFQALPVGRPVVQQLLGVASLQNKLAFFFSSSGYSSSAVEFADEADISLFEFSINGGLNPVSDSASNYWAGSD